MKQLRAFNLADGSRSQNDIARQAKVDQGNFSRTTARWVENGVAFWIGEGKDALGLCTSIRCRLEAPHRRPISNDEQGSERVVDPLEERSQRAAFILGAGASRGALAHVLVNNKRIKAPLNSDFFKVAHTYARARGATSADARRFERLKAIFKTDLPAKWPPLRWRPRSACSTRPKTSRIFYTSRPGPKPDPGERRELEDFLSLLFDVLNALDQDGRQADWLRPTRHGS